MSGFQIFQGQSIQLLQLDEGFVELWFDRHGDSINKLDERTVREFSEATALIAGHPSLLGVLVTSAKSVFHRWCGYQRVRCPVSIA